MGTVSRVKPWRVTEFIEDHPEGVAVGAVEIIPATKRPFQMERYT